MTTKHVNEIINGKAPITVETAVKMEDILGLPCSYWLNLEVPNPPVQCTPSSDTLHSNYDED
jgi:hypothetical protein